MLDVRRTYRLWPWLGLLHGGFADMRCRNMSRTSGSINDVVLHIMARDRQRDKSATLVIDLKPM